MWLSILILSILVNIQAIPIFVAKNISFKNCQVPSGSKSLTCIDTNAKTKVAQQLCWFNYSCFLHEVCPIIGEHKPGVSCAYFAQTSCGYDTYRISVWPYSAGLQKMFSWARAHYTSLKNTSVSENTSVGWISVWMGVKTDCRDKKVPHAGGGHRGVTWSDCWNLQGWEAVNSTFQLRYNYQVKPEPFVRWRIMLGWGWGSCCSVPPDPRHATKALSKWWEIWLTNVRWIWGGAQMVLLQQCVF